jgi:hypothetical protein
MGKSKRSHIASAISNVSIHELFQWLLAANEIDHNGKQETDVAKEISIMHEPLKLNHAATLARFLQLLMFLGQSQLRLVTL